MWRKSQALIGICESYHIHKLVCESYHIHKLVCESYHIHKCNAARPTSEKIVVSHKCGETYLVCEIMKIFHKRAYVKVSQVRDD